MLIASTVGIALVKGGLIPTKVSALGIDADVNERGLLWVLLGVISYFLVAFIVYAYADFQKYLYTLGHEVRSRMDKFNESHDEYKFRETTEGMMLMQTYMPRTPDLDEIFRLQAQIRELENNLRSDDARQIASERHHICLMLKNSEIRMNRKNLTGKAKEGAEEELRTLRASKNDLTRMLTAIGAKELIELQDRETSLNALHAELANRNVEKYYDEIGLDIESNLRFFPAAFLKFSVDFVIPALTAMYAMYCTLRGR